MNPNTLRRRFAMACPFLYEVVLGAARWCTNRFTTFRSGASCSPSIPDGFSVTPDRRRPVALFFIHWMAPGGAEWYALECARLACRAGLRVVWIVDHPHEHHDWVTDFLSVSSEVYEPWKCANQGEKNRLLFDLLESSRPVIIHLHHSVTGYLYLPAIRAAMPEIRVLDSTHIIELKSQGFPRLSRLAGPAIDVRNVVSRGLGDYFVVGGCRPESVLRTVLIPESLPEPLPPRAIGAGGLVVLIVGRLVQQKRPYLFLPFVRQLAATLRGAVPVEVRVVGDGPYHAHLKQHEGDYEGVTLKVMKAVYDKDALYGDVDCVMQLSENEGISLVSYEAILRDRYFFATRVGQQEEILESAFLLPSRARMAIREAASRVAELARGADVYRLPHKAQREALRELSARQGYQNRMFQLYSRFTRQHTSVQAMEDFHET